MHNLTKLLLLLALLLMSNQAFAQEKVTEYVPDSEITAAGSREGWDGNLSVAANVSVTSNSSVVGQVDGESYIFGLSATGGFDFTKGVHEWRNTFAIGEAWSKTPALDPFVKSNDSINYESLYNYFIYKNYLGSFARFHLQTTLLSTEDLRPAEVDYTIQRADGEVQERTQLTSLHLADGFSPITASESVGLFTEPYKTDALSISFRTGFGGRHTLADGVLVLSDDDATSQVEVKELEDVHQGGVEFFLGAQGRVLNKRIKYTAGTTLLLPLINNDSQERGVGELTKIGAFFNASLGVVDWMAINYQYRLENDPQLLDELQQQHSLVLTLSYTLIDRDEVEEGPSADDKLKALKKKLDESESRAKTAEEALDKLRKSTP